MHELLEVLCHQSATGGQPCPSALSLPALRVIAFTVNLSVWSSELTTEVPCLLVACTTTTIGLSMAMVGQSIEKHRYAEYDQSVCFCSASFGDEKSTSITLRSVTVHHCDHG